MIWSGREYTFLPLDHISIYSSCRFNKNKSIACGCQRSAVGCLMEDKKNLSKKGRIILKKMHFELSPFIVWIALWVVNTYSLFPVNIFSNNSERYYRMSKLLHDKITEVFLARSSSLF